MGLDINRYHYGYHTLHILRQFALDVEGNKRKLMCKYTAPCDKKTKKDLCVYCLLDSVKTKKEVKAITKFYEFINHSDCEGGYVSKEFRKKKKYSDEKYWGDLKEMQKEVRELDKHTKLLPEGYERVWNDFKRDILEESDVVVFS